MKFSFEIAWDFNDKRNVDIERLDHFYYYWEVRSEACPYIYSISVSHKSRTLEILLEKRHNKNSTAFFTCGK